jgi:hypothetical protein
MVERFMNNELDWHLEGSLPSLINVLSRQLPGRIEEIYENLSLQKSNYSPILNSSASLIALPQHQPDQ